MDHTIVHFEIPADDVEKLRKFYSELFGWKIEKMPGPVDYWGISTVPVDEKGMPVRPGVNGGMMKRQNPEHKPVNYIIVESVDEYVKKIEALGGKIVVPKMEIPGIGWWAMALDPEGNQFAILQADNSVLLLNGFRFLC
jgi:predicted enzyme related to lactoylglutathione lyase